MKDELIADIWNTFADHISEKARKDVAYDFVNVLLDNGIKESVLEDLLGIDPYLDDAINYSIDGEESDEGYDDDYYEDEE